MPDVNATAAGGSFPIPEFLRSWESDVSTSDVHVFKKVQPGTAPGPYQKVTLHNFTFLGKGFQSGQYVGRNSSGQIVVGPFSGAGVCQELKGVLVAAQRRIFQDYARQQVARGRHPTESGFVTWCGIKTSHVGWQFRGGNHRFGAALDIDPLFNPYTVTRTGGTFGGERPSNALTAADQAALLQLRQAAIMGYESALQFMFGKDLTKAPGLGFNAGTFFGEIGSGETSTQAYRRFSKTSEALAWYMSTGMVPTRNNPAMGQRQNFIPAAGPVFRRDLEKMREMLALHIDVRLKKTNPNLRSLLRNDAELEQLRNEIESAHEAVRRAMIFGSWRIQNGQLIHTATRDPCYGFLSLREEIVVGIREAGTRWGAVDFGPSESGDIMHFDLGAKRPAVVTDENADQVTFAKQ